MTLTLNSNWIEAFQRHHIDARWLVRIWVASSTSVELVDGVMDGAAEQSWPIVVNSVTPLKRELDVLTRKMKVDTVDVSLVNDQYMRELVQTYGIAGTRVEVLIGAKELAEADFEPFFVGIAGDIIYSPQGITIPLKTAVSKFREATFVGSFVNDHPLECLTQLATASEVNADMIDSTSLAYDVDTTRSHWVVDRSNNDLALERAITTPTKIGELADELVQMIQGTLFVDELGKIKFQYLDLTRAAAANWTDDDVWDVRIVSMYGNRANKIVATAHASPKNAGLEDEADFQYHYYRSDTQAQGRFPYSNSTSSTSVAVERKLKMSWVSGSCACWEAFGNPSVGATVPLIYSHGAGYAICGMRWPAFPGGTQPANSQATASRLTYMLIDEEIVAFDQFSISTDFIEKLPVLDLTVPPHSFLKQGITYLSVMSLGYGRIAQRGCFGTTAINHSVLRPGQATQNLFDVTIAVDVAGTQLTRFSNGAPVVELRTSMREYAVQVGDFVTLELDEEQISWLSHAGVDTNVKWEVTGKTVDLGSDNPGIAWTLVYATETSPPGATLVHSSLKVEPRTYSFQAGQALRNDDMFTKGIVSGMYLTTSAASLTVTLGSGLASAGNSHSELPAPFSLTLGASKDSYIYWECAKGSIVVRETALGAGKPTLISETEILIWFAKTDATGVTSTQDFRNYATLQVGRTSGSLLSNPYGGGLNPNFTRYRRGS